MTGGDRRTLIADEAINLLAQGGAHGLTHLAVDRSLGWANGSTSYYYRTRAALVEAAAGRLVAVDSEDARQRMAGYGGSIDSLAMGLAKLVAAYSSGPGRARTVARYELFLLGTRDSALSDLLDGFRSGFIDMGPDLLPHQDEDRTRRVASAVIAAVEGLLLTNIRLPRPAWTDAEVEDIIRSVLALATED